MKQIIICRGIPGAGKNTWAEKQNIEHIVSADDYFMEDGEYNFDPKQLTEAHAYCMREFMKRLPTLGDDRIAVCNTNLAREAYMPYVMAARGFGHIGNIKLVKLVCEPSTAWKRNIHGVPKETVFDMSQQIQEPKIHHPPQEAIYTGKEQVSV